MHSNTVYIIVDNGIKVNNYMIKARLRSFAGGFFHQNVRLSYSRLRISFNLIFNSLCAVDKVIII